MVVGGELIQTRRPAGHVESIPDGVLKHVRSRVNEAHIHLAGRVETIPDGVCQM